MSIARIIKEEYAGGRDLSGIGGVETGRDAAEFILLGANTVQVTCLFPLEWYSAYYTRPMFCSFS